MYTFRPNSLPDSLYTKRVIALCIISVTVTTVIVPPVIEAIITPPLEMVAFFKAAVRRLILPIAVATAYTGFKIWQECRMEYKNTSILEMPPSRFKIILNYGGGLFGTYFIIILPILFIFGMSSWVKYRYFIVFQTFSMIIATTVIIFTITFMLCGALGGTLSRLKIENKMEVKKLFPLQVDEEASR